MKKVLRSLVAVAFVFTLLVSAFGINSSYADSYDVQDVKVRIYKYGTYGTSGEKTSMAQKAIIDNGTVITKEGENYFLTIPVKPFYVGPIKGEFKVLNINGVEAENKNNKIKIQLPNYVATNPANKVKVSNVKVTSTAHVIVGIPSTHDVDFVIEK
ncbi:hypothetical protein [Peptostreptococcus anaerobius]|uniref:hypothetical protein n=1 Tax=Peptostreptococcus anaerobius TaxID=1261 RepID=UPI0007677EC5|nr:hypothetical protein [Peptostreptococcus anaerobius]KXB72923.1 hypothetical protein HMPREF3183_00524 [Peptostreptococcus anaerobius]